jgi:hypothetical protein
MASVCVWCVWSWHGMRASTSAAVVCMCHGACPTNPCLLWVPRYLHHLRLVRSVLLAYVQPASRLSAYTGCRFPTRANDLAYEFATDDNLLRDVGLSWNVVGVEWRWSVIPDHRGWAHPRPHHWPMWRPCMWSWVAHVHGWRCIHGWRWSPAHEAHAMLHGSAHGTSGSHAWQ